MSRCLSHQILAFLSETELVNGNGNDKAIPSVFFFFQSQWDQAQRIIHLTKKLSENISVAAVVNVNDKAKPQIWSEWRLTVIAATVRIALVDILDLSEVDIPARGFLYPAVGWG